MTNSKHRKKESKKKKKKKNLKSTNYFYITFQIRLTCLIILYKN